MIRCIAATVLVVCGPWVFAAVPGPENPAAVADWFARVLRDGDPGQLARLVEPGAVFHEWDEPRDVFSRYECISAEPVDAATAWLSPDAAKVRVRLRTAGFHRAGWRPPAAVPDVWHLELRRQADGAWLLRSAMTEEKVLARCMAAEGVLEDGERFFTGTTADPRRVLFHYGREAIGSSRFAAMHEHAVALARESASASFESDALMVQALLTAVFQQNPLAVERARHAIAVARSTNDLEIVAAALLTLGNVYLALRRNEEALAPLQEAGSLAERADDPVTALKAQYMHGHALGLLNRHFACLRSRERLLALSRRYGWREGEEVAALGKADVLEKLGKRDAAIASLREAAGHALAAGNPEHAAIVWHNIAAALVRQRRLDEAIEIQRPAAAMSPPGAKGRDQLYAELTAYQVMAGRLEEARESLAAGAAMFPGGVLPPLTLMARSALELRSGRAEEALADARAAFDQLERHPWPEDESKVRALTHAARALRTLGRREEAIQTLRNAIDIAEADRRHASGPAAESRISAFERHRAPYLELVEILAGGEDTTLDALRVAEQFKARTLMELSAGGETDLSAELSSDEREREKALELRVIEGNRALFRSAGSSKQHLETLSAARLDLESFRSDMRLKYPRVALRDVAIPAQLALPDSDAVEFVVAEERVLAFIVPAAGSGRGIRVVAIPIARDDLTARIERYLRALGSRSFGYRAEARALYDALLAPLAPHLDRDAPLCIVPDGSLWSLPFQTLIAPNGKHLAERRPITVAPSLAILHTGRARREGAATLLAFGNPRVGGTAHETVRAAAYDIPMSALPEAEAEVRRISELYEGGTIHVGGDATESAFKRESSQYRVLHLATHGFVASGAPMYSGLVFSSDPENDGILEAREVAEMKLDADLAVLSACDTAGGEISEGEGVVGLSWAFLAAGCPTTVVSHWKADSAATARLMVEFHRQLRQSHPPAEALRRAQLALMRSEAHWHPYYWAPFVVVGRNASIAGGVK